MEIEDDGENVRSEAGPVILPVVDAGNWIDAGSTPGLGLPYRGTSACDD